MENKINETKSWFFENINKIDKSLASLTKNKRTQITKTRDERGPTFFFITTDLTEIKTIIREYH